MMMFMHFTSQIPPLAIGFGVGYWLLTTANTHKGSLKTVGQALGWILIAMSIIISLFSCYYSLKIIDSECMHEESCLMHRMIQQNRTPMMDNIENDEHPELYGFHRSKNKLMMENKDKEEGHEMQEESAENENMPTKR